MATKEKSMLCTSAVYVIFVLFSCARCTPFIADKPEQKVILASEFQNP